MFLPVAPAGGIIYVAPGDDVMVDRTPIIVFGEVRSVMAAPGARQPSTDAFFEVEAVLKGKVAGGTIVVRQPGGVSADGVVSGIFGLPIMAAGDRMLLFLEEIPDTGAVVAYRTVDLSLGMFFEVRSAAGDLLVREAALHDEARASNGEADSGPVSRQFRSSDDFRRWIGDRVGGVEREVDYFTAAVPADGPVSRISPYRLITSPSVCDASNLPLRWQQFDRGRGVGFTIQAEGQVGVPGRGIAEVARAMRAWNDDPESRVQLVNLGTTNKKAEIARSDGVNSILFEDPHDEIRGYFPSTSGILAITRYRFLCSETNRHKIPGNKSHEAVPLLETDIVTQDGYGQSWAARTLSAGKVHEHVMAHELGHAIGLAHSCAQGFADTCSALTADSLMKATASGKGIYAGGQPNADDLAAVRFLYPAHGGPASPSDLTAKTVDQHSIELAWEDNSSDETAFDIFERPINETDFKLIASVGSNTTSFVVEGLPPATYRSYRVASSNAGGRSSATSEASAVTLGEVRACAGDDQTLCLNEGRFQVTAEWATAGGATGRGGSVPLTADTGAFWFFDRANVEMVVKLLDGCGLNEHFWVFAGGLTDTEVQLTVVDTETGIAGTWFNPEGTLLAPVQDIEAFETCGPGGSVVAADRPGLARPSPSPRRRVDPEQEVQRALERFRAARVEMPQAAPGECTVGDRTLCLENGRFRVRLDWETEDEEKGAGMAMPLTGDTGLFWFFEPANIEIVIKVLDGCAVNGKRWVFAGGLTDVSVEMTVVDTQTGATRTYTNFLGRPFRAIKDTTFFSCSATDDHGDTRAEATDIPLEASLAGFLGAGDTDFFVFRIPRAGRVQLRTTGLADTEGVLMNAAGTVLGSDSDSGADENFRLTARVGPGTYYVRVTGKNGEATGAYELHTGFSATTVISRQDRNALIALYRATDGANWTNNENWLSNRPLDEWYGVTTGSGGRVTWIELSENGLRGEIPAAIGDLDRLLVLLLSGNQLSGAIPRELGNLRDLVWLFGHANQLTGEIPTELARLRNLVYLYVHMNQLTGEIPAALGRLPNLAYLRLGFNELTGGIPGSFRNLRGLNVLEVRGNQLTGGIPPWLGELTDMRWLWLGDNQFSGGIPPALGNLTNLVSLRLWLNELTGPVPPEIGRLTALVDMYIHGTQLSGPLPDTLLDIGELGVFWFQSSDLCAPATAAFDEWLAGIEDWQGDRCD